MVPEGEGHLGAQFKHGIERSTEERLPKEEREELALEVNTVLSGIDKYLQDASGGKDFIIDMYNIPPVETAPIPPQQGIMQLRELAQRIDAKIDMLPLEWEVGRDSLRAAATFLEEKEKPADQKTMNYWDNVKTVSGFYPEFIPERDIENDRRTFARLLRFAGYPNANGNNESLREAFQEYHSHKVISGPDDIKNGMVSRYYSFRAKLAAVMRRPDIYSTNFEIKFVKVDAPFMAWERIVPGGKRLDINIHESKMVQWGWEEIDRYARHEGVHMIMGDIQANEIKSGKLDSIAGYLLIPSPACWALEGVAQDIDELSGIPSEEDGKISVAAYRTFIRAGNNALLYIASGQKSMDEAIEYMEWYAPQKSREELEKYLTQGTQDAMWTPYLPNYGHSDWKIMNLAENLSADGKKDVLIKLMSRPWTYEQFDGDYGQLAS